MVKKNIIQTIREKEMDRKEFLKYIGIVLLGLIGLKGLIALLSVSDKKSFDNLAQKSNSSGYGNGKYGI